MGTGAPLDTLFGTGATVYTVLGWGAGTQMGMALERGAEASIGLAHAVRNRGHGWHVTGVGRWRPDGEGLDRLSTGCGTRLGRRKGWRHGRRREWRHEMHHRGGAWVAGRHDHGNL
jgi:hypothetical protein